MKTSFAALATATMVALSSASIAATQGTAGDTASTGTIDIELLLTPQIIIGGLEDVDLSSTVTRDGQQICIGGFGFDQYEIEFGSANGSAKVGTPSATTPFLLAGTSFTTETIPYTVEFIDNISAASGTESTDGSIADAYDRVNTISDCTGAAPTSTNAQLYIEVDPSDWADVSDSTFQDVLTITVAPAP
ncbi:hypothetical protein [Microbulbifer pacificus]|uniref:hypothetical protein n=1 Tax=Microbulbifer pacificus TaxID=407164 RepID=UPI000CF41B91|nr:hypothetical protein [Microbulbifer pacificus]